MNNVDQSCPYCGGEKGPGASTFSVDRTFGIVVVRDVPALVCLQCDAAWFEDSVAARLERIVDDARRRQAVVAVMRWAQDAA